jgi:hypothetical protein
MSSLTLSKEDLAALRAALPALHRITEQLASEDASAPAPLPPPTPAQSRVSRAVTAAQALPHPPAASRVSVLSMGSRASSLPPLTPDESALDGSGGNGGDDQDSVLVPTRPAGAAPSSSASRVSQARGAPSSSASRVSQARNLGIAQ